MKLNEKIKEIRIKNNLTQKEFAQKIGVSLSSLQKYEYGDFYPNPEIVKKIINLFNVSLKDVDNFTEISLKEIDNFKKNIANEVLNQIKNQRHKEWINKKNIENDNLKEIKKIIDSYNSQSNITNDEINNIEQKIFELLAYTGCSFLFNEKTQNITINFIKYDMNLNIKISINDLLLILDLLFSNFKNVFTDFLYLTKK